MQTIRSPTPAGHRRAYLPILFSDIAWKNHHLLTDFCSIFRRHSMNGQLSTLLSWEQKTFITGLGQYVAVKCRNAGPHLKFFVEAGEGLKPAILFWLCL